MAEQEWFIVANYKQLGVKTVGTRWGLERAGRAKSFLYTKAYSENHHGQVRLLGPVASPKSSCKQSRDPCE